MLSVCNVMLSDLIRASGRLSCMCGSMSRRRELDSHPLLFASSHAAHPN